MTTPTSATGRKAAFRTDIQGLRGLAVLLVVVYHAGLTELSGGFIGVDIFFVISGYLITGLIVREIEDTGGLRFVTFYARRIRRLMPAAAVVVIATIAVAATVYSPLELKEFSSSAFATALYASNFWFAYISTDYLAADTGANPLLHTWSLAVEEQFYLIWPFLLFLAARLALGRAVRGKIIIVMAVVSIASLIGCIAMTYDAQPWAFFASPFRAWEFGLGGIIALWASAKRTPDPLTMRMLGWAGFLLVMYAALFFSHDTVFPGYNAILPVVGTCLIILAGESQPDDGIGRILSTRPMRFIGDISYSLYLWHWPVFVFLPFYVDEVTPLYQVLGVAVAVALAWITYVAVENPVRLTRSALHNVIPSIALGTALIAVTAGASLGVRHIAGGGIGQGAQALYQAAREDIPKIYPSGCHVDIPTVEPKDCRFGATEPTGTIVLFGDSHAAHWFPALEAVAVRKRWQLISLTKSGCPAVAFPTFNPQLKRDYTECDAWRQKVIERIRALRPDVVLLGNSHTYVKTSRIVLDEALAAWRTGTAQTANALRGHAKSVILMHDTPRPRFDVPTCLSRADWHGEDPVAECMFNPDSDLENRVAQQETDAIRGMAGVTAIDMAESICLSARCTVKRDGKVIYHDSHHMTATFSASLADDIEAAIFGSTRQPLVRDK